MPAATPTAWPSASPLDWPPPASSPPAVLGFLQRRLERRKARRAGRRRRRRALASRRRPLTRRPPPTPAAEDKLEDVLVTPDFDVQPSLLKEYYVHLDQRLGELQGLLGAGGAVLPSTYEKYMHGSMPAGASGNPLVTAKEYYEQLKQLRADSQVRLASSARVQPSGGCSAAGGRAVCMRYSLRQVLLPAMHVCFSLVLHSPACAPSAILAPTPFGGPPLPPAAWLPPYLLLRPPLLSAHLPRAGLLPCRPRGLPRPAVGGRGRGRPL